MKMEPSRPFSSGMEYEFFHESFCERCKKLKMKDGMPMRTNCKIETAMVIAMFNTDAWPKDDIVQCGKYYHLCKHFETDNMVTMHKYKKLFEED